MLTSSSQQSIAFSLQLSVGLRLDDATAAAAAAVALAEASEGFLAPARPLRSLPDDLASSQFRVDSLFFNACCWLSCLALYRLHFWSWSAPLVDCCILQQLPTDDEATVADAVAELAWLLVEFIESDGVSEDVWLEEAEGLLRLVSLILGTKAFWLLLKMLELT